MHHKQFTASPLDTEFFKYLRTDESLEQMTGGRIKAVTIRSSRSRGKWPYDTFYIGRTPHTDERQFIEGIKSNRRPGRVG